MKGSEAWQRILIQERTYLGKVPAADEILCYAPFELSLFELLQLSRHRATERGRRPGLEEACRLVAVDLAQHADLLRELHTTQALAGLEAQPPIIAAILGGTALPWSLTVRRLRQERFIDEERPLILTVEWVSREAALHLESSLYEAEVWFRVCEKSGMQMPARPPPRPGRLADVYPWV